MKREEMLRALHSSWDIIIIGGGATGLGSAVDAASRGYRTLLLEQSDFAKATSSKSTKLIHGGLRYLQQGNIKLVTEALKERGLLCLNAPHLVHSLPFLVPNYHWWEAPFYGIGLKVYDLLAGKLGIESSKHLSKEETLKAIPTLEPKDLRGGVIYYDGQFDDSRLAITLAQTACDFGAILLNYVKVTALIKKKGKCIGVKAKDQENGKTYKFLANVVINATGVFTDQILSMDVPKELPIITPSQGIHIVLNRSFQPKETAVLVPHTEDNRILFLVPWHGRTLLGTTDTPVSKISLEPKAHKKEIDFLLRTAAKYLSRPPQKKDILSVFAGLRPLVGVKGKKTTATLSRDHVILVSASGLVSIAGGKWTTYRKMAEDVIDQAIKTGGLLKKPCATPTLRLHGWQEKTRLEGKWSFYGSDAPLLKALVRKNKSLGKKLHPKLPYLAVEVIWAAKEEMARTVEDVLARRTRSLLLDARASLQIAPAVAKLLAKELKKDKKWEKNQVKEYTTLVKRFFLP